MAKRSTMEQLPEAVRHAFERKLVENSFADYAALAEWLQEQGYEISRSAAHRYGQKVQRRFAAIKSSTEAARLLHGKVYKATAPRFGHPVSAVRIPLPH